MQSVQQDSSVLGFKRERSVMLDNTTHATMGQFAGPHDRSYSRLRDRISSVIFTGYPDQARTVIRECTRSVSFRTMAEEVLNTYQVLRQLVKTFSSTRLDLEDVEMLIDLARQCRDIISSMNQYLERYFAHRHNDCDETEIRYKVEELRNALQFRNSLLNSHYANVMLRSVPKSA